MKLRIQAFAAYFLIFLISALGQAQVTYEDAFPGLSFEYPTEIVNPGDGTNRLFVLEQAGRIKVFLNNENTAVAETFLDITGTVSFSSGQEIGLLGLAFHPDYASNGLFYVYHTRQSSVSGVNVEIVLARYSVRADNPNQADPSSRLDILSFDKNQGQSNHNGGKIAFGPDGYLYVSIGDGGWGGDPNKNAQNLENVFGSILRIDVDLDGDNPVESNPDLPDGNYEIPADNPRVGQNGLDEQYAWGIRNTWKFSFDTPLGNMWGADVGQGDREEINLILKGGNYGWNRFEGKTTEDGATVLATTPDIKPIFEYGRGDGDISITGGYIYRGASNNPQIKEKYIFGDYISGRVWALDYDPSSGNATSELLFRTNGQYISSFGLDENGELYFSDYGTASKLYKIIGGNNGPQTVAVDGVGDWYAMAQGTNGNVAAMAEQANQSIVIGGGFSTAGTLASTNIALYDPDSGWNDFGNGTNGDIKSIAIDNEGKVYFGGDFSQIAGIQANNIAVWNGSWSAMDQGTNGPVSSIAIAADNRVYVGGTFEMAGGTDVNNIALWEDGSWAALTDTDTGTPGTNNEVRAISIDANGHVYIGGNFDSAGGGTAPRIAVWDGTHWDTLGTGTSGFVQAIAINQDYIYAGGNFAVAGNGTVNRIARWNRNTAQWEAMGLGLSGNVNALALDGENLYVGGSFETATDQPEVHEIMNNVARWSEDNGWQALGKGTDVGVDNLVNSLVFDSLNSRLYVGGSFTVSGKITANNIAYWGLDLGCDHTIVPEYTINGTTDSGLDEITVLEGSDITLGILPKEVSFTIELVDGSIISGEHAINNINKSHKGTYTFNTQEGCSQILQIIVESIILDSDNDGVPDNLDQCPNTAPDEAVDNLGCTISELPIDNYTIMASGLSCNGSDNGIITVSSKNKNFDSSAMLVGQDVNNSYTFTENMEITNLKSGLYEICLTNQGFPNYNNCSNIVITQPEELLVTTALDTKNHILTLKMSGANNYKITHNGSYFNTSENTFKLILDQNINIIQVSTDLSCQGLHEEIITLKNSIIHPNPFDHHVILSAFKETNGEIEISIYSTAGELIMSSSFKYQNGTAQLEIPNLSSGTYYLLVNDGISIDTHKIVKQ